MKLLSYVFIVLGFLVIASSCIKEEAIGEVKTVKLETKKEFLSQSKEVQKERWITRIESSLDLNLSEEQKFFASNIVTELKNLEKGKLYFNEDLKINALEMAKITPVDDFLSIFVIYYKLKYPNKKYWGGLS